MRRIKVNFSIRFLLGVLWIASVSSLGGSSFSGCRGAQFKGYGRSTAQSKSQPLTLFTDGVWEIYWNAGEISPGEQSALISTAVSRLQSFQKALTPLSRSAQAKIQGLRYRITILNQIAGGKNSVFFPSELEARVVEIQLLASEFKGEAGLLPFMREAFHAVQWAVHPGEKSWIREGLNLFFVSAFVPKDAHPALLIAPTEFPGALMLDSEQYGISESESALRLGHSFQYVSYLDFQCGERWFWSAIEAGIEGSFVSKSEKPQCRNFATSAFAFEVARIYNRTGSGKNPDVYRLGSSQSILPKPLEKFPSRLDLAKFDLYQPIYMLGSVELPPFTRISALGIKRVWIEKAAPFSVKIKDSVPGRDPSRWDQILIHVSTEPDL